MTSDDIGRHYRLSHSWISDPQKLWEIINICWPEVLSFGVICYIAIDLMQAPVRNSASH